MNMRHVLGPDRGASMDDLEFASRYAMERRVAEMLVAMILIMQDFVRSPSMSTMEQELVKRGFNLVECKDMSPQAALAMKALVRAQLVDLGAIGRKQ